MQNYLKYCVSCFPYVICDHVTREIEFVINCVLGKPFGG